MMPEFVSGDFFLLSNTMATHRDLSLFGDFFTFSNTIKLKSLGTGLDFVGILQEP